MNRRLLRLAALTALVAIVLGAAGVLAWDWIGVYWQYRQVIASLVPPGQEPTTSFEEFLRYRRAIEFYDATERLEKAKATAEEVRVVLGEPDQVEKRDGHDSWFYSGPAFREWRQPTLVVRIDHDTSRVISMQYVIHG